jgi:SpoVK/Ycf46/Vps4 family AAA+-type ATPase
MTLEKCLSESSMLLLEIITWNHESNLIIIAASRYFKCTEGFSSSDIKLLCKDEAMKALQRIIVQLDNSNPVSKASSSALLKSNTFNWYRNK